MTDEPRIDQWHLDRRVPISIIIALALQTITFVYLGTTWKADIDHRIGSLEKGEVARIALEGRLDTIRTTSAERLTALETKFEFIQQSLNRIERATVSPPRP